jgi:hypothetical protein
VCIREAEYEEHLIEEKILRAVAPYTTTFPSLLEHLILGPSSRLTARTQQGKTRTQVGIEDGLPRQITVTF